MPKHHPKVDAYIANSAEFARPILGRIRSLFHQACPQIEEEMKWNFPHFVYKGIVGSMAAFKQHCSFGFWKAKLMKDPHGLLSGVGDTTMGASRVTSLEDLPSDKVIIAYVREAVALNENEVNVPAKKRTAKKTLETPDYFLAALKRNNKALAHYLAFSPSAQREYVEWVTEAKQEKTRDQRLATAIEWLAEGKTRHWKYKR
jgi:uncharacterized protein YdeI (YjbR/CyaY-like superfamily)